MLLNAALFKLSLFITSQLILNPPLRVKPLRVDYNICQYSLKYQQKSIRQGKMHGFKEKTNILNTQAVIGFDLQLLIGIKPCFYVFL